MTDVKQTAGDIMQRTRREMMAAQLGRLNELNTFTPATPDSLMIGAVDGTTVLAYTTRGLGIGPFPTANLASVFVTTNRAIAERALTSWQAACAKGGANMPYAIMTVAEAQALAINVQLSLIDMLQEAISDHAAV